MPIPRASAWPEGARCVVSLTIDFDGPCWEAGRGLSQRGYHAHGRYSAKRGIPRLMRIAEGHGVPITFFVSGYDAEAHPDTVAEMQARGHEVAAHGYLHEAWDVGAAEPELLKKTHDILTAILGKPVTGWRSPSGRKTALTMRTLRSLGYVYDSSDKDFDLPYLATIAGEVQRDFVILPNNTSSLDDYPFYRVSWTPTSEVLAHWQQEFDAAYAEGGFFNLTIHPRSGYGSGTPSRAGVIDALLRYIKERPGVRFLRMHEIAQWCLREPARWQFA